MNFSEEGGIWVWRLGRKIAVVDGSAGCVDWIVGHVTLETGETPQQFAERVVQAVLSEQDDWRPDVGNFARWAKLLFPDCVNLEPAD